MVPISTIANAHGLVTASVNHGKCDDPRVCEDFDLRQSEPVHPRLNRPGNGAAMVGLGEGALTAFVVLVEIAADRDHDDPKADSPDSQPWTGGWSAHDPNHSVLVRNG